MWVFVRKTMFCKGAATPGLNKVGGIMIKTRPRRPVIATNRSGPIAHALRLRHPADGNRVVRPARRTSAPLWSAVGRVWPRALAWSAILTTLLVLAGCVSTDPAPVGGWGGQGAGARGHAQVPKGYYRVRKGDSLGGISHKRHVSVDHLIRWNGLTSPYALYVGRVLRVAPPPSAASRGLRVSAGPQAAASARTAGGKGVPRHTADGTGASPRVAAPILGSGAGASALTWAWPLEGAVIQGFRAGDPARTGLRISCRPGEEVHAAGAGVVVYSGSGLKGYGNLIIVKHNKTYLSAYGFNRRLFVKEGDSVKRGQALAECGEGPGGALLLHFEVRRNGASVNPLLYLTPRE